jgi:glycosyltransferase involved in cell wall biosynthesis
MGIRVANVIEEGRFGGPQRRIVDVAVKLRKHGIETTVIYPKGDSQIFQRELHEKEIGAIPLEMHRLSRSSKHILSYVVSFVPEVLVLTRVINKGKSDVIHCNGSWQVKGVIAAKIAGVRVVWHLNDTRNNRVIHFLFKVLSVLPCEAYIVAARRVRETLSAELAKARTIFVIQAPVDTEKFSVGRTSIDRELHENIMEGCMNIVTVGNVNQAKGLENFIEMASILNGKYTNLKFYCIGDCFEGKKEYLESLKQMCEQLGVKNISFVNGIKDVRSFLKGTDIYVCASLHEASPMSVWEALSMERPIVSTDVGDISSFITDGENGFVVPPGNSEALAEKVEILLKDKELRRKFSKEIRKIAVEHLDIDICVRKHAQAYRYVLNLES